MDYRKALPEDGTPTSNWQKTVLYRWKKEGRHRAWWPDGKPQFDFQVHLDAYEGELKEWNAKGLLIRQFHYENGQEVGSQRLWWDDSTVRANYQIRNGKKYGLIGIKLCKNPYDSIK